MVYDFQSLRNKYKEYSNIYQKISNECEKGILVKIKRGLYTDDLHNDKEWMVQPRLAMNHEKRLDAMTSSLFIPMVRPGGLEPTTLRFVV